MKLAIPPQVNIAPNIGGMDEDVTSTRHIGNAVHPPEPWAVDQSAAVRPSRYATALTCVVAPRKLYRVQHIGAKQQTAKSALVRAGPANEPNGFHPATF